MRDGEGEASLDFRSLGVVSFIMVALGECICCNSAISDRKSQALKKVDYENPPAAMPEYIQAPNKLLFYSFKRTRPLPSPPTLPQEMSKFVLKLKENLVLVNMSTSTENIRVWCQLFGLSRRFLLF